MVDVGYPGFYCKSLLGVTDEIFRDADAFRTWRREDHVVPRRNETGDLRRGVMALRNVLALDVSPFARFSGSFDFRLLQHYRRKADVSFARERQLLRKHRISAFHKSDDAATQNAGSNRTARRPRVGGLDPRTQPLDIANRGAVEHQVSCKMQGPHFTS
jgi:hypothetical protein